MVSAFSLRCLVIFCALVPAFGVRTKFIQQTPIPNAAIAEQMDEWCAAGNEWTLYKKLPQGVLGPLPVGWKKKVESLGGDSDAGFSIVAALGGLDKVAGYDEGPYIGGYIAFQLDGDGKADFYPLLKGVRKDSWKVVSDQDIANAIELFGERGQLTLNLDRYLKDNVQFWDISAWMPISTHFNENENAVRHGMTFEWVQQADKKYMVPASALPGGLFSGKESVIEMPPSWGKGTQTKDSQRADCYIIPQNQDKAKKKENMCVEGTCDEVYMCQVDASGFPINYYA